MGFNSAFKGLTNTDLLLGLGTNNNVSASIV